MFWLAYTVRACRRGAAALAGAVLVGCGGGGDLVEPFRPQRQLSFGDESSVLAADGSNYGVNAVNTEGALVCNANANWVQFLAANFGMVFPQCQGDTPTAVALMLAAPGAKVADVVTQIDTHLATDAVGPTDLVTVMVGMHDILEQYARFPAADEATIAAELRARGVQLAQQINRIAELDGRVIVATVPDLGLSPFGATENAANAGRAALLSRLTFAFNARMRANIINDGRRIGLALTDEMVQAINRLPSAYGFANATQAACQAQPPACTTATLVSGTNATTWLWASPTLLSAGGQLRLGQIAVQRATNNPF